MAALPGFAVTPDGKFVAAIAQDRKAMLFPVDGGQARVIPGIEDGEFRCASRRTGAGLRLEARRRAGKVTRVDVERASASPSRADPRGPSGVERISNVLVTPDGKGYAYCFTRLLSDLFVVEGLK